MKLKVLQLMDSFHQGGSETQSVQLIRLLQESQRYEIHVACLDPTGNLRADLAQMGYTEIPAYPLTSFYNWNTVVQVLRLARYLREHRIEIVQTHDFYTNVFGMMAAWLARVPVRIAARRETLGFRSAAQNWVERRAFQLAHAIIANAQAVREMLITEGVAAHKIVTVHNGLNLDRLTPKMNRSEALTRFNLPPEAGLQFVTILAHLYSAVKDHPTFLRAAQRVRQTIPQARFIVAGEGPLTGEMQQLAQQLGIENDVFFTGRCHQVAELFSLSSVCVLSSTAEGFSNSILEYQGASRPVVATDVGGAREAIVQGETGYLVTPGDAEAMAAHIIYLLSHPAQAAAMGEGGRENVAQKFSCQNQLEQTEQLYQRLLPVRNRRTNLTKTLPEKVQSS